MNCDPITVNLINTHYKTHRLVQEDKKDSLSPKHGEFRVQ